MLNQAGISQHIWSYSSATELLLVCPLFLCRQVSCLTMVELCFSASSCLYGLSPSWNTGRGRVRPYPTVGTALTSKTLRWDIGMPRYRTTSSVIPVNNFTPWTGASSSRVHGHGTNDHEEPGHWGWRALLSWEKTVQQNCDWMHGHHHHGKPLHLQFHSNNHFITFINTKNRWESELKVDFHVCRLLWCWCSSLPLFYTVPSLVSSSTSPLQLTASSAPLWVQQLRHSFRFPSWTPSWGTPNISDILFLLRWIWLSLSWFLLSGWEDSQPFRIRAEPDRYPHVVQGLHHSGPHPHTLGWVSVGLEIDELIPKRVRAVFILSDQCINKIIGSYWSCE